jgi:7,8-dihydropterin-6-yl-methyl-4-(beta-D-ribofuranosyl)aminobenzene 5'-phosphate synthase
MKIKILVENISRHSHMKSEHGLSLLIHFKDQKILFDTGQSDLFYKNAVSFSEDLSQVSMIIISHGHYDHGGGLKKALDIINAPIYIQEDAFNNIYSCRDACKYIGLEESLKNSKAFVKVKGDYEIEQDIILLNEVKIIYPLPEMNGHLYIEKEGIKERDEFFHEQSLILNENNKNILITGCSHLGILNIISACEHKIGRLPNIVFGGFHLSSDSSGFIDPQIDFVSKELSNMNIEYYTGHCTGVGGFKRLEEKLKDKKKIFRTGDVFDF